MAHPEPLELPLETARSIAVVALADLRDLSAYASHTHPAERAQRIGAVLNVLTTLGVRMPNLALGPVAPDPQAEARDRVIAAAIAAVTTVHESGLSLDHFGDRLEPLAVDLNRLGDAVKEFLAP